MPSESLASVLPVHGAIISRSHICLGPIGSVSTDVLSTLFPVISSARFTMSSAAPKRVSVVKAFCDIIGMTSYPESASASIPCLISVSALRERTGLYTYPAWQKRHTRLHQRMISTATRFCTTSIDGTINRSGGSGKTGTMRFLIRVLALGLIVFTSATVPSSL